MTADGKREELATHIIVYRAMVLLLDITLEKFWDTLLGVKIVECVS